jgi:hypothetical protein
VQISGLEEKKRESIMVVANQTKSRLQLAEDALHRVQVEAEKGQFELAAKKGKPCGRGWGGGGCGAGGRACSRSKESHAAGVGAAARVQ